MAAVAHAQKSRRFLMENRLNYFKGTKMPRKLIEVREISGLSQFFHPATFCFLTYRFI